MTPANHAPTLVNPGAQLSQDGAMVSLALSAADADSDPLTFTSTPLPKGLTLNPQTGLISGTLDTGAPQTVTQVTVTVSDGFLSSTQTFDWTTRQLYLTNPGDKNNAEGDTVSLALQTTAYAGASLSYSAVNLPLGLSLNGAGLIAGKIAPLASNQSPWNTTITVSAGGFSSSQTFSWNISYLTLVNPGPQTGVAGKNATLQLQGTSPLGDPLTFTATGLPQGLAIDPGTGLVAGFINAAAFSVVPYQVHVQAQTASGHVIGQDFSWTVSRMALLPLPEQYNAPGDSVDVTLATTAPNSFILTYSAAPGQLPPGLALSSLSGHITGAIDAGAAGQVYSGLLSVSADGQTLSQTVVWHVSSNSSSFGLNKPADKTSSPGDVVQFQMTTTTIPAGQTSSFTAFGLPPNLSMDANGLITGVFGATTGASP